jgi:hypothetical protein
MCGIGAMQLKKGDTGAYVQRISSLGDNGRFSCGLLNLSWHYGIRCLRPGEILGMCVRDPADDPRVKRRNKTTVMVQILYRCLDTLPTTMVSNPVFWLPIARFEVHFSRANG